MFTEQLIYGHHFLRLLTILHVRLCSYTEKQVKMWK